MTSSSQAPLGKIVALSDVDIKEDLISYMDEDIFNHLTETHQEKVKGSSLALRRKNSSSQNLQK